MSGGEGPASTERVSRVNGTGSGERPGQQPGSPGQGRTQKLALTDTCSQHPETCAACGEDLPAGTSGQAHTAWDEIELAPLIEGEIGLRLSVTRYTFCLKGAAPHVAMSAECRPGGRRPTGCG